LKKIFFILCLGFSVGDVTSGCVFAFFGPLFPTLDANPISEMFGLSLFWKLDYHPNH